MIPNEAESLKKLVEVIYNIEGGIHSNDQAVNQISNFIKKQFEQAVQINSEILVESSDNLTRVRKTLEELKKLIKVTNVDEFSFLKDAES
jgi:hypothetical protein